MKHLILALVALAPLPALADYQCIAERQCGGGACEPYTGGPFLIAQTGESFRVTADAMGRWAFHCHLLYHMAAGMFREVVVA